MSSSFIHVVACDRMLIFKGRVIFHCMCKPCFLYSSGNVFFFFLNFWLHWVFIVVCGLSLVRANRLLIAMAFVVEYRL